MFQITDLYSNFKFIIDNKIIHRNQLGFVTSSSLAASSQLMNYIDSNLDKKQCKVGCLFIDLKKAK